MARLRSSSSRFCVAALLCLQTAFLYVAVDFFPVFALQVRPRSRSRSRGAGDAHDVAHLSGHSAGDVQDGSPNRDNCPICLEQIRDEKALSSCGHKFCTGCIGQWLSTCELEPSCPVCREVVQLSPQELSLREGIRLTERASAMGEEGSRLVLAEMEIPRADLVRREQLFDEADRLYTEARRLLAEAARLVRSAQGDEQEGAEQ
ncbi:unnamed protein product [Amoebophrya sp. A120]|nr:unnamed protein product [Amoebophrya sp. A120]|eukprot:GSA120T00021184001.1